MTDFLRSEAENLISEWFQLRGMSVPGRLIERFDLYHDILIFWSERINLMSKNDRAKILESHFLDSLTPLDIIPKSTNLIDIGSGAGFPAVPLAMARPDIRVTMIESRNKKVSFLQNVIDELKLGNLYLWGGRIEDFRPEELFDIVTVRAVALTKKIERAIRGVLTPDGKIVYFEKRGQIRLL
jgi:16S rRNA (guanine527-N7)-methyltransferase